MKNKKISVGLIAALVVLAAAFGIWKIALKPTTNTDEKTITVTVVHADKTEKTFELKTEKEFLGDALFDEKIVTEKEFKSGFYTLVDGESADFNSDGAWWSFNKDGEMTSVGPNEQPIADGEKYEIIYSADN